MPDLSLKNIIVRFSGLAAPALDIPELVVRSGERLALSGPSGCGKTTFVHLVAGLNKPHSGTVRWGDTDFYGLCERRRDQWRGLNIGLVMQDFHLFAGLSAVENVLLPLRLGGHVRKCDHQRACALLSRVQLHGARRDIRHMSRGQMQRVAVARALLRRPAIVIADEPTANLDPENGRIIADLLLQLCAEEQASLLAITHDEELYARFARQLAMRAGKISADERVRM